MRQSLRSLVDHLTQIGIPSQRIALEMQLTSSPGLGQRAGLEPSAAWFEIVKLEALAAKSVATQFKLAGDLVVGLGDLRRERHPRPRRRRGRVRLALDPRPESLQRAGRGGRRVRRVAQRGPARRPRRRSLHHERRHDQRNAVARFTSLTGDPGYAASVLLES